MIDAVAVARFVDEAYAAIGQKDFVGYFEHSALGQVLRSFFVDGGSATGAIFAIDGYNNFDDIGDYSGSFQTISLNGNVGTHTGSVYYSYAETCHSVGIKYGRKFSGKSNILDTLLPVCLGVSYSRTYYSNPWLVYEGTI